MTEVDDGTLSDISQKDKLYMNSSNSSDSDMEDA
jgi:hypothetical protein